MKKIIAAHDLSGLGKASLGAVIPVISAMGGTVCSLPTAVLSTVTGVFEGYAITDLTDHMKQTVAHWKSLDVTFDCIYSGFLGSAGQVDVIISAIEAFSCYAVVDPVFADNGRLYPTMDNAMVENMRRLVRHADLITPNITEAQFLLGETSACETGEDAQGWLLRLCGMGPGRTVITGCKLTDGMYVMAYDKQSGEFIRHKCDYAPVDFHGTGDIFTGVLTGALMRGDGFSAAIALAADFVKTAIDATVQSGGEMRMGVMIEKVMNRLI